MTIYLKNTGDLQIDDIQINDDTLDNFNDYTIIIGRLTSGTLATVATAVQIGTASNKVDFDDYNLYDGNTIDVVTLESDSGTGNLRLGRTDGVASSPGVYFNTSAVAANYNAAIVSSGGTGTDSSGTLNAAVVNADGFTINGNKIWNVGNITFNSTNVVSTGVIRDENGDFAAGTITADLTGAASENVLKAGDTMTGSLTISGASSNFSVQGTSLHTGIATFVDDLIVDTDTLFVDASADRVGINATANPRCALDVFVSETQNIMFRGQYSDYAAIALNNSTTENDYNILSSTGDRNLYLNRPTGQDIRFRENNSDQIYLKTGGYFGINGDPGTFRAKCWWNIEVYRHSNT